ncbi:MAG: hypothetical protein PHT84_05695 [Candidatus Pacebacteria bacterium]|jgi:hypothetical protein|nr:hypothetical protein [Bacilli bacterium]MDD3663326.1 hypothetical protein [Candidatus Paceibacterota bacterium]
MKYIYVLALSVMLVGCTTSRFYNNGPIDATAISQSISINSVDASNTHFSVYLINSKYFALIPEVRVTHGIIDRINNAIIFDDKQIAELRSTCRSIIDSYDNDLKDSSKIIEYHLVSNNSELSGSELGVAYNNVYTSSKSIREFNRVVFRLQYLAQPRLAFNSGKTIQYMYGSSTKKMSIDELKNLLKDIQE